MYDYSRISPPTTPPPMSPVGSPPAGGVLLQPQSPTQPGIRERLQKQLTATAKRQKYIRRIFRFRQMDFEYAFWQMLYLFISPQKV